MKNYDGHYDETPGEYDTPLCDNDWFEVGCGMKWRFLPEPDEREQELKKKRKS